ncbi:MAG: DUF1178 family protein [Gemmobacter sp.]
MIRYDLRCPAGHAFDSWFASAAAYDRLRAAGHVVCPHCGSTAIDKALMAPPVVASRSAVAPKDPTPLSEPDPRAAALAALKREIEARSEYVGLRFATEARRIHAGEAPERMIHGEARADEARALIEDGVPVAPLPFVPTRKAN